MMKRKASRPIWPLPMCSCRSTREPRAVLESFRCNRGQAIQANQRDRIRETFVRARFLAADVVAGGEDMRGIETNTKPFRLAHVVDDVGDLFESLAETRSLTGRRFERDPGFHFRNIREHAVDRFDDLFESGFFAGAEMRARMQNQKRQFKLIGACQFFR